MSYNTRKYASVESATCFCFDDLIKKLKSNIRKRDPIPSDSEYNDLMYKNLRAFKINNQTFDFVSFENNLGGRRWFVKCPKCGRSSLKLYLPTQHEDREQRYLCKECHKLKNLSMLLGATKRYKKVIKPLKRLEKIRTLLLKRETTSEKSKQLLDEYEGLEKELSASNEYRLWKFQKEHGIKL